MKVLQVLPTLCVGGAEGFVTNLGVSLTKLGADVRFYLLAGARHGRGQTLLARLQDAGIEVVGDELRNIRSPRNLLRLVRLIRIWRPDIVQANLYSCEIACAASRVATVGSGVHYVRRLANTAMHYRPGWRARMLERPFELTIACSPAVAEAYTAILQKPANERLATIFNGGHLLNSVPTSRERAEARQALNIPEQALVVCNLGRMYAGKAEGVGLASGQKAYDVIIKSFADAFGGDSNCVLVLVGDGPLRPEAEALAKSLGVEAQVRFLGEQPEPWPALKAADIFFFPSRYEGLPNVLPEAASCGLPVVASDIPEIRYLYPGDAWLLEPVDNVVKFADALRVVREKKDEFSRKACEAADGFRKRLSMKACAEKYLQAYESTLKLNKKK